MALIEQTLFGVTDKVQIAIERLRAFQPKDRPYWTCFSGGKDSCVILELCKMAGVNFEAHYNVTSVDPPELVRFIKDKHPEVHFDIPHDGRGKSISMWSLLKSRGMPPTRIARYCCEKLKESSGKGTVSITGVRWAESQNRKKNQGIATIFAKKVADIEEVKASNHRVTDRGGVVMNDDNDEARRAVEVCYRTHKTLVNPIIDWTDEDVWEFIQKYNVPYCKLYDAGETRLGCIGCPIQGPEGMKRDFEKYPKYKEQYLRCFDVMYRNRVSRGLDTHDWTCGKDIFDWWVGNSDAKDDALTLFSEEE